MAYDIKRLPSEANARQPGKSLIFLACTAD